MTRSERKRYILFKIVMDYSQIFNKNDFINKLWDIIWNYYGMNTANKVGLWVHELDLKNHYGIIQCSHKTKEIIISALSLIKRINDKRIIFSPVMTSGTIKKIKEQIPRFISGDF